MKKIIVTDCGCCPYVSHGGGFGNIAYIPNCGKSNGKKLPYTEHASNGRITAHGTGVIPEWCPLDDDSETSDLRDVLKPFAELSKEYHVHSGVKENGDPIYQFNGAKITLGDIRKAEKLLEGDHGK